MSYLLVSALPKVLHNAYNVILSARFFYKL